MKKNLQSYSKERPGIGTMVKYHQLHYRQAIVLVGSLEPVLLIL